MRRSFILSTVVLCYLLATLLEGCTPQPVSPTGMNVNVGVNPALSYSFEGWGTSLAWWAEIIGGKPDRSKGIEHALFTQGDQNSPGLGLNIIRYNLEQIL
jgi:hypothetical protein